jgi:hypothetical protein
LQALLHPVDSAYRMCEAIARRRRSREQSYQSNGHSVHIDTNTLNAEYADCPVSAIGRQRETALPPFTTDAKRRPDGFANRIDRRQRGVSVDMRIAVRCLRLAVPEQSPDDRQREAMTTPMLAAV